MLASIAEIPGMLEIDDIAESIRFNLLNGCVFIVISSCFYLNSVSKKVGIAADREEVHKKLKVTLT